MNPELENEFNKNVADLRRLVAQGHRSHLEEISAVMAGFHTDGLGIRYFIMKSQADPRLRKLMSAQSFFVFGCKDFYLRLNAWYPRKIMSSAEKNKQLDNYFSIERCHNHSYDFFTVGLIGPGYETEFRWSDSDVSSSKLGDKIVFNKTWTDRLEAGKTFFVPKDGLFHTQFVPESYSVSLNLILNRGPRARQFELAEDRETIDKIYDFSENA